VLNAYARIRKDPFSHEWQPAVLVILRAMGPRPYGDDVPVRDALAALLFPLVEQLATGSRLSDALELAREINDNQVRSAILGRIASHLDQLEPVEGARLWQPLIHKAATRERPELLSDLTSLLPLIDKIGDVAAFSQAVDDVTTACRWWV